MNGTQSPLSGNLLTTLQDHYSLYFPHTSLYEGCYGYWLASPSAYSSNRLINVNGEGQMDADGYKITTRGLRPVICIKSSASATLIDGMWQLQ